jgi:hypothetical protein
VVRLAAVIGAGVAVVAACAASPPSLPELGGETEGGTTQASAGDTTGNPADVGSGSATGDATASGSASDTAPPVGAQLVLDAGCVQLPPVDSGGASEQTVTVRNAGDEAAVGLLATIDAAEFTVATTGRVDACGEVLGPQQTCSVTVQLVGKAFGPRDATLTIAADNADGVETCLHGEVTGATTNLLVNGDAEQAGQPPPGWTQVDGVWQTTTQFSHTGARSLQAALFLAGPELVLAQVVDVTTWQAAVTTGAASVALEGWLRSSNAGNDPGRLEISARDGDGLELDTWSSANVSPNDWEFTELGGLLPATTATVEVRLVCVAGGFACNAFFDDLVVTLSYG